MMRGEFDARQIARRVDLEATDVDDEFVVARIAGRPTDFRKWAFWKVAISRDWTIEVSRSLHCASDRSESWFGSERTMMRSVS